MSFGTTAADFAQLSPAAVQQLHEVTVDESGFYHGGGKPGDAPVGVCDLLFGQPVRFSVGERRPSSARPRRRGSTGRLTMATRRLLWLTLGLLASVPTSARELVLDACEYPAAAAAAAVWSPVSALVGEQLPSVSIARRDDGHALCLPCPFTRDLPRVLYHRDLDLDLSRAGRLEFDLWVDHPEAIGTLNLYFLSGNGCYRGTTGVGEPGWHRVRMTKASFRTEGTPAGWDQISGVRISPWKGVAVDAECRIDNLLARFGSGVAVVQGTYSARQLPAEANSIQNCAELVANLLDSAGILPECLSDEDVERGLLDQAKVAILPYNPRLSEAEGAALTNFVKRGGKLVGFYVLPAPLPELLGVRRVDWRRRERPGQFLGIDFAGSGLAGLPDRIRQDSGNITVVEPVANARVIGRWVDAEQQVQEPPGVVLSDTGAFMAHTLLPGDTDRQEQFLTALVGHFCPAAWAEAAQAALDQAGRIGPFETAQALTEHLHQRLGEQPRKAELEAALRQAAEYARANRTERQAERWPEAVGAAKSARQAYTRAYLLAQRALPGEWRAVSNHPGTGGEPGGWSASAKVLAECGFNAVLPDIAWGGVAHYASDVLPRSETFRRHGDQLAQCVEASHRHGLQVHAWKVCWNLGSATAKEVIEKLRAEDRLQVTARGEPRDWLCPSHPANQQLEAAAWLEIVRNYDVDGIMFDYIRYANRDVCFCDGCRQRFPAQTGQTVAQWPAEVTTGSLATAYNDWRCQQITNLVRTVSREAHRLKPYVRVSAAVFARYPDCRRQVAQDWVAWAKEGLLDFVIPMDYADSGGAIRGMVQAQLDQVGARIPVCPSLFVTLSNRVLTADRTAAQILGARQAGAAGFNLFDHSPAMAADYLRQLGGCVIGGGPVSATDAPRYEYGWTADDPRQVTIALVGLRPQRQPVKSLGGTVELQDLEGRTIAALGPAPTAEQPVTYRLTAPAGGYRLAVSGRYEFGDGTNGPFLTRSRALTLP